MTNCPSTKSMFNWPIRKQYGFLENPYMISHNFMTISKKKKKGSHPCTLICDVASDKLVFAVAAAKPHHYFKLHCLLGRILLFVLKVVSDWVHETCIQHFVKFNPSSCCLGYTETLWVNNAAPTIWSSAEFWINSMLITLTSLLSVCAILPFACNLWFCL